MKFLKIIVIALVSIVVLFFIFNVLNIYQFSQNYSEKRSDVAIVLGAGTTNGNISPVFRERINHSVYLHEKGLVTKLIFTGGIGEKQRFSDSRIALQYALKKGVPANDIYIEESSRYTHENLEEAKLILDSLHLKSVLLVSDPLHMKRSIEIARSRGINCESSPTKTSMYQSTFPKFKSLLYEAFFYTLGRLTFDY